MGAQTEIDRIKAAKASIKEAIIMKGVAVPSGTTLDGFAALIAEIMASINAGADTNIRGLIKGNGSEIYAAKAGEDYAPPALPKTATLTTTGWDALTQTVSVDGLAAGSNVIVSPAPASIEAWGVAGVFCSAQAKNALTFSCTSAPEGDLTANILVLPMSMVRLPAAYQEVEYIQSSAMQYIDTGFIPNQDTRVVMVAKIPATPTTYAALFGSRKGDTQGFWCYYRPAQNMFAYRYGNTGTNYFVNTDPLLQNTFDANKNVMTIGENSVTAPIVTFEAASSMFLFAVNDSGAGVYPCPLMMYSCQIYDNGNLVRDFVPCYRKSDNAAGLYDLVNGVFYGNAGNGSFAVGADVN